MSCVNKAIPDERNPETIHGVKTTSWTVGVPPKKIIQLKQMTSHQREVEADLYDARVKRVE